MQDQVDQNQTNPQPTADPTANPSPIPASAATTKPKGKYKVEVIRDKCISAASCVHIAGKTFKLDEENLAVILGQNQESDETILLGAQSCPTGAIIVTDTETGEQVWPKDN
ncbi:MAG: ferredoxin [Patescibacteria group bacterium]